MFAIIYNPHSGGFSAKKLEEMQQMLVRRGHECQLMPTEYAGHAVKLAAKAAADGAEVIVSYGGDGTTNEVLNGMAESGVCLMLAPSGTGNDMIRTLGLPRDPVQALEMQLDSPVCRMDAIQVNDRWCMNVAGLGLDVIVLREYERLRSRMFGSLAYRIAIFRALKLYKPENIRVSFDGGATESRQCAFFSFGNGKYFGGGMKCLPDADPFDGLMDVLSVRPISRLFIVCILPTFFAGKHTKLSPVTMTRAKSLTIEADEPFWMQLDGELYHTPRADVQLHHNLLCMRLPRK